MLPFSKYQGLGNDFLILDGRAPQDGDTCFGLTPAAVQRLCDRRFGVGGDGVIVALPPQGDGELRMRIFNADGSEPEMCGNGIRCLARFLADSDGDLPGRVWQVETLAGRIVPELMADGRIRVDMGAPFLEPAAVPTTLPPGEAGLPQGELEVAGQRLTVAAAGMGNPHVVIPVADLAAVDLERLGPALETHPAFPARTNVHFVQVLAPDHLAMRVWERGAGPTLACGTGACATLVACHRLGLCESRARVDLPGGPLEIRWDGPGQPVLMTGPAEPVFDAVVAPSLLDGLLAEPERLVAGAMAAGGAAAGDPAAGAGAETGAETVVAVIDCSVVCVEGCVRPEACPSAEARARVEALLGSRSLDELVQIATSTAESRSRERILRDLGTPET
ncbi:MAG: diaminopimelate epimerase [Synechococcaceae cyanobacterium]|nr:diaminopimelate epimerase [Synechococcaceae cyanobacterium]